GAGGGGAGPCTEQPLRPADHVRDGRTHQLRDGETALTRRPPRPPHRPRSCRRLRHATAAPTSPGTAMQASAIRKAGDVGVEARAPATAQAAMLRLEPSAVASRTA